MGVVGLMGKSSIEGDKGVGSGLRWCFPMRWSSGDTTTGLRWRTRGGGRLVSLDRRHTGEARVEGRSSDDEDILPGSERDEVEDEAEEIIWGYPKIETWRRLLLTNLIDSAEETDEVEGVGELVRDPIEGKTIGSSAGVSSR